MKRLLAGFVTAISLMAAPAAEAAPILFTDADTVVAAVFFDLTLTPTQLGLQPDLDNVTAVSVTNNAVVVDAGAIGVDDTDTVPINTAIFFDLALNDLLVFDFDLANAGFSGTFDIMTAFAAGTAPFGLTDPLYLAFLGQNLGVFNLIAASPVFGQEEQVIGTLAVYALDYIASPEVEAVPEPATLALVGTGLAYAARRRRSKKAN